MILSRGVHKLANLVDCKGEICSRYSNVLEGSYNLTMFYQVIECWAVTKSQIGSGSHRRGNQLGLRQACPSKQLEDVFLLRENNVCTLMDYFDTQKLGQGPKILNIKGFVEAAYLSK